jgi:hypothetical protein
MIDSEQPEQPQEPARPRGPREIDVLRARVEGAESEILQNRAGLGLLLVLFLLALVFMVRR